MNFDNLQCRILVLISNFHANILLFSQEKTILLVKIHKEFSKSDESLTFNELNRSKRLLQALRR